jgi:Predicted nucleotide-binding protein containing TIR-like domain
MRSEQHQVVRDNVLFELGLFIGRLGHKRCFFLVPESGGIRLPTDLFGLNSTEYESNRRDSNWVAAVNPACTSILQVMRDQTHLSEIEIAAPIIRAHIGASSEHVAPAGKEVTAKIKIEQYKKSFLLKSDDPVHRERLSALPYASYNRTLQGWVIPQFKGTLVRQDLADLL